MDNVTPLTPIGMAFNPREISLPGDLTALAVQFLVQLQRRGYAENTTKAYQADLEQFVGFMAQRDVTMVQTVSTMALQDFIDALLQAEMYSGRTVSRKFNAIRSFFKFAVRRQLIREANNPTQRIETIKFDRTRIIAPDQESILALIDSIPIDSALGLRDRAMFRLMFDAALRVSGVLSLDMFDKEHPPKHSVWPNGRVTYTNKGRGVGESVCDDMTINYLHAWLDVRKRFAGAHSQAAIFLSRHGQRMTRENAHCRIKKYGKAVGMPHIHCHLLRHRRIGDVMDSTDVHLANYIAGHKNLSTTINIYGHQNLEKMRARLRQKCALGSDVYG